MYSTQEQCWYLSTSDGLTAIKQKLVLHQERGHNQLYCPVELYCTVLSNTTMLSNNMRCFSVPVRRQTGQVTASYEKQPAVAKRQENKQS